MYSHMKHCDIYHTWNFYKKDCQLFVKKNGLGSLGSINGYS